MHEQISSFGDARRMILNTINELRQGTMNASTGLAIAANMKVLNDSVQVEVNAAKLSYMTEGRAFNFGKVVQMGQRALVDARPEQLGADQ